MPPFEDDDVVPTPLNLASNPFPYTGDAEMDDLPPGMRDEEDDVQAPQAHRLHHEQVGCPDALDLVGQECPPTDGAAAHHDAKLEQLAPDTFGAQARVIVRPPSTNWNSRLRSP